MKFNLVTILIVGIAVLATLQIKSCFDPRNKDEVYKVKLEALEEDKKELQDEVQILESERDSLIIESRNGDTEFKNQTTKIEYRIKNIPVIVDAMGDDDLKRSIEKRFGNPQ